MNIRDREKNAQLCGCAVFVCSVWCVRGQCVVFAVRGVRCVVWGARGVCKCYVCVCVRVCVCGMWRVCDMVYDMQRVCACMRMRTVCVRRFYPPEATLLPAHIFFLGK